MAVNPNFTNANAFTSYFGQGGAGGSNFPNGLSVGPGAFQIDQGNVFTDPVVYVSNSNGVNSGFLAQTLYAGDSSQDFMVLTSTTLTCVKAADGTSSQLIGNTNLNTPTSCFNLQNVNSASGVLNTTASNATYNPLNFTIRPDQAAKGGIVYAQLQYDAVDTGANYALVMGASNTNSFITSVWPGYISMPLQLSGAAIEIASDNETFLYMDGKAGALGNISTGTPFVSGSNFFSSITAPSLGVNANMAALLSTLASTYPACFS